MRKSQLFLAASWAVLGGLSVAPMEVFAQDATPGSAPASTAEHPGGSTVQLGEVIVTARKRAERLQDVPLAITAVTAETLRTTGVTDLRSVINLTPGVTIDATASEANSVPVIRGQYNLNNAPGSGGQPNVAVFLDGIYIQNVNAISLGLLDIERLEIVKGPVSALYGRNGFAGAINYVSKQPTDELHSSGLVQYGEYNTLTVRGDVNGPIIAGILKAGLGVDYERSDGDYEDSVTHLRAGGYEKKDFKGEFDFTPTSRLDVSGGYYYGDDHFSQNPIVYANPNCSGVYYCGEYVAQPLEVAAIPSSSGNSGNDRKVQSGHFRVNYDLGFADVTYLGGYNHVVERSYEDFVGHRNGLAFTLTPGPGSANVFELFGADDNTEDYSHEIRVTSKQNQRFRWSLGGDYYHLRSYDTTLIGLDGAQIPAGQSIGAENFGLATLFITPNGSPSTSNYTATLNQERTYSAFGSFDFDIVNNLTLSAELRYTNDGQSLDILRNAFIANVAEPYGAIPNIGTDFVNYRTTLKYKFSDSTMVYASAASGTKAGGYNGRATIPLELAYAPENNTTYEVGGKTNLMNDTLQLDVAVYHIDSDDLQINGPSSDPKNVGQVVKNFGGTTNTGFELSALYKPFRDLILSAGFAYTDPKFNNNTNDVNGVGPCNASPGCAGRVVTIQTAQGPTQAAHLDGLQLEQSSKYQLNLAADYRHSLGGDLVLFGHGDFRYESKQYANLEDTYYIGDRYDLNLRAGIEKGPISVAIFARNVLDDRTPIFPTQATELNNFSTEFLANLPDPRTVGGEIAYHF